MKKRGTIILAVAVAVVTAVVLLALAPKHMTGSFTCSTADGETAEVAYDVQYYARRILPSFAKGTVTFNGVSYTDSYTKLKDFPHVSDNRLFPSGWWKTNSSSPYNTTFLKSDCDDFITAMSNAIILFDYDCSDGVCRFCLAYMDDSNAQTEDGDSSGASDISGIIFYGPAQNAEEARQVAASLGLKTQ